MIDKKTISRALFKMLEGEQKILRYGVLLERKRAELGSKENLIKWMEHNKIPLYGIESLTK